MTAAGYVRSVQGFFSVQLERIGENMWQVRERDGLNTIRFDRAGDLVLDLASSEGVLGARRKSHSLYVALDPAHAAPKIALLGGSAPEGVSLSEGQLALTRSQLAVSNLERTECGARLVVEGFNQGKMLWLTAPDKVFHVSAEPFRPGLVPSEVASDADGRLEIPVSPRPGEPVSLQLTASC